VLLSEQRLWLIPKPKPLPHVHGAWCGHYTPSAVRWWLAGIKRHVEPTDPEDYSHYDVLLKMIGGRSAEDAEALDHCYARVVHGGAGHRVTGEWCVCLSEDPPPAAVTSAGRGSDGNAALLCVKADLEHAADLLPISWSTTQRTFETLQRVGVWQARYGYYLKNLGVREIDRWLEPRDPETRKPKSAALSNWLMSRALGGVKDVCPWPGVLTPSFALSVFEHRSKAAFSMADGNTQGVLDDLRSAA
jgi:hypothetical protein